MKARRNSKINNMWRGKNNSLLTKKQGYKSVCRAEALGYCTKHSINIGKRLFEIKACANCECFIKFNEYEGSK